MRPLCLLPLFVPALALAEPVHIPGPHEPLEAEMIPVEGAAHAVVIIPGSGPIDRDGNAPQMGTSSDTYRLLAEGLEARGIASLRVDKRGFFGGGEAISDPDEITIEAYAEDARGWITFAADLAPCAWLAGHSEGGLVALVAAQDAPDTLCGLILLATPGRPIGTLMIEQFEANPAIGPLMPEIKSVVADLEAGLRRDPAALSADLQALFSDGLQRYMIDLFSYDPAVVAGTWEGPVLIAQGDADRQVRALDAELLGDALPQARYVDLPGGTHLLKADVEGRPFATYTDHALPLHEDLLPGIVGFLADTTGPD